MSRPLAAVLLVLLGLSSAHTGAQAPREPATDPEIRLVLLIAADQFRYDYLKRFGPDYTGGLRQLTDQGAFFTNAHLEHYPSVTAVGHATMLTGATPAVSGIIGNDWFDRASGRAVTSVSDESTQLVGVTGKAGSSPHRLVVTTVADSLKAASRAQPGSDAAPRTIGVSLKDRSAILMVGHSADLALWYDTGTGLFVTSTYYMPELPKWVQAFNAERPADKYAGKAWTFLDSASGAGRLMPAEPGPKLYGAIYGSTFGNELLNSLALAALVNERLGQRGTTDVLAVSYSSNDSVGHTYGPDSPEVRDISVRTDRAVADLLARVDALVGLQRTLVIFTADHGVAPVPEVQAARRMPGGRLAGSELWDPMQAALAAKYGDGRWILATAGTSPYLNHELIASKGVDAAEVRREAARVAAAAPRVMRVYTREQILDGAVPDDLLARRIARSYHPQRSGDLEIVLEPYWLRSSAGTTHGTPYHYDSHIPLILMGPGVVPGRYDQHTALNDLAPTVATLLGIEVPEGASGQPLWRALSAAPRGSVPATTN
jgi:predicted AlkP superfamily pyrophosphatase or phosphodiesterase